jgi:CheY-like chemotaxis protein/HPt (histidine-containing phosphotransfer) domain-containing protein
MSQGGSPLGDFEARLTALKAKMVAGLPERAREIREAVSKLDQASPESLKDARRLAHRLAGIAGSHGFRRLTEVGRATEQLIDEEAPLEQVRTALITLADACDAVARDPEGHTATPGVPDPLAQTRGRPVLAVEDDDSTAHLLMLTLGRIGGFAPLVVDTAERALELLAERRFDLILVDAMLPGMNGLAFCKHVRETMPSYRDVAIVVLSAASPADLGWNLEDAGEHAPDGWLNKPIRAKSLILDLEPFLRRALERGK